jgi:AcrR family transcriptional regulator
MGRPREHDETTTGALLDAAERIVDAEGLAALSVRGVSAAAGTTTRAVYARFGSKEGLIVALGARAFALLGAAVAAVPETDRAGDDLVAAGLEFRRFAHEHPALFAIAIQRALPDGELFSGFRESASRAFEVLEARVARLDSEGGLGGRSPRDAAWQFHALCEGLAVLELRDGARWGEAPEARWRAALGALVAGFAAAPVYP